MFWTTSLVLFAIFVGILGADRQPDFRGMLNKKRLAFEVLWMSALLVLVWLLLAFFTRMWG